MKHLHRLFAASLLAAALCDPPLPAVDFIRGDVNGDGVVSLSDAARLAGYQFRDLGAPDCLASGDVDASGALDLGDIVVLITYLFSPNGDGEPPAAPFPDPGPEPAWTQHPLGCAAVGG